MTIRKTVFGTMPDGRAVYAYNIENASGASVTLLTLGGIIQSLVVPDRNGAMKDVVCGYDCVDRYLTAAGYQGAIIGRVCNRIGGACFTLDGKEHKLFVNSGTKDSLHGGKEGFNRKLFTAVSFENEQGAGVKLYAVSPDGEENYPGTLRICVTYTFTEENRLILDYQAETDKPTVVNMTNHAYFNLTGVGGNSVMEHELYINSEKYLPTDGDQIPLPCGYQPVKNTVFDFTALRPIGHPIDHGFALRGFNGMVKRAAFLCERAEGRSLTVYTDLPVLQVYTACVMDGPEPFKGGVPQRPLHAICLETQFSTNAVNRPDFIPCVLRPGELYHSTTVFEFSTV